MPFLETLVVMTVSSNFHLHLCECVCQCLCLSRCCVVTTTCAPRLMAALQARTKLSSNEPGVCPPDLRGAATANKTHKDPRPWHWPSPRLPAILPLPHTAACCFVPTPRRGSSSRLLFKVSLPPMSPLSHRQSRTGTHTHTKICKTTHSSR